MKKAKRLYSWEGFCKTDIFAVEIKSRSDARKLGPFVTDDKDPVLWVNWGTRSNSDKKIRPYFRRYPKNVNRSNKHSLRLDNIAQEKLKAKSDIHRKTRDLLADALREMIREGKNLEWVYNDDRASDFNFSGNLLADVVKVETEYELATPFGFKYRFDIALIGEVVKGSPIILGAIEVEYTHRFEMLKAFICKLLGFPLVSITITAEDESNISKEWCLKRLKETTYTSHDGLRRNYIYIHNMLYPVYANIPRGFREKDRHQYIIFTADENVDNLIDDLESLRVGLDIPKPAVLVQKQVCDHPRAQITLKNEGSIAGPEWMEYNTRQYIRLNIDVPRQKMGAIYKFHLAMTLVLNTRYETYVGYKYSLGLSNEDVDEPLWIRAINMTPGKIPATWKKFRLLPKHLSEPVRLMLEQMQEYGVTL